MEETFDHIKAQTPTANAYDSLSNQINTSFQHVFERLDNLQSDALLAYEAGSSHAIGGEKMVQWKPILDYALRDETIDEEIISVEAFEEEDDFDENDPVNNAIIGLQAIREQYIISKILSEEDTTKWSLVSWPSSLSEAFKRSHAMEKLKTKLTFDAFRATHPMPSPIPAPRIVQIDEGSPQGCRTRYSVPARPTAK